MKRFSFVVALAALGFFAGCAGGSQFAHSELVGVWRGEVTEGELRYDLVMAIQPLDVGEVSGTTAYSGELNCSGVLTFEGEDDQIFRFREHIDQPETCADNGRIDVWRTADGALRWEWFRSDADEFPDATATLRRGSL